MDRPFIFCHMETSVDGKIMGKFLWLPEEENTKGSFYGLVFGPEARYTFQALILGRTTVEDNITCYKTPEVDHDATVPAGDFIAPGAEIGRFYIAVDGNGRLAWPSDVIDEEGVRHHVVSVLTERTPAGYKDFLRKKGISYLVCGKERVDLVTACDKIKNILHVDRMMLGGGAVLNWSFMQLGLVDELSQVISPAADGNPDTQPLFLAKPGITTDQPIRFKPLEAAIMPDHAVWIRYAVGERNTYDFDNDPEFRAVHDMIQQNK